MNRPRQMDAYIRVSRVGAREGPGYISPSVQREQIETWAALRHVQISAWHEDMDQSGGKLRRPGLDRMLSRIEAKETDGVIVAKLDRLSRLGVSDALKLVERITDAGATLAALDLGIDPTTPFGEFGLTIMLALARMERRRLTESWAIATKHAIERGAKVSPTPYGYERQPDGTIVPHPTQAPHVRRAYELAASQGARAAAQYLERNAPGRSWDAHTTRRMLARRTYLGESFHGENTNSASHEALVSPKLWAAAQTEPRAHIRTGKYPLSGSLICGTCGAPMVAGPRASSGGRRYRCSAAQTRYRGPKCPRPAGIASGQVEEHIRVRLREILGSATVAVADGGDQLALAERALHDAEIELQAFAGDLTLRRALGASYSEHRSSRVTQVEDARARYHELARKAETRERITGTEALEDLELIAPLLSSMDASIQVAAARGAVADRVRIRPFDD
jgi:site-specific DNA recombinase